MNIRTFVAILSQSPQYNFLKMRGGGQRLFGTFPKIHQFWGWHPSLTIIILGFMIIDGCLVILLSPAELEVFFML